MLAFDFAVHSLRLGAGSTCNEHSMHEPPAASACSRAAARDSVRNTCSAHGGLESKGFLCLGLKFSERPV